MFRPLLSQNSQKQNWNEVNNMIRQVNKEQTVKTFKQPSGNAIINGRLPYAGGYGSIYYDTDGVPRIVIGILPDGSIGMVVSKEGIDVLTVF